MLRSVRRSLILFCCATSAVLLALSANATATTNAKQNNEIVPGEIIVKVKPSPMASTVEILSATPGVNQEYVQSFSTDDRFALVKLADTAQTDAVLMNLKSNENIEYAEPNFYMTLEAPVSSRVLDSNDEKFKYLWGMKNTGQTIARKQGKAGADISATKVWPNHRGSKRIVVAVVDTGIDTDHEDLRGNIWTNPGEIAGNGIDDDGNGYIDDMHGWNFSGVGPTLPRGDSDVSDGYGHGTHVAGTIGATGGNGTGVVGVNWQVSLMALKIFNSRGRTTAAGILQGVQYATMMGVDVMNNSWGGGRYSRALEDAIKEARERGIVFVASAGNSANDNDRRPYYPASYNVDNILVVAASDNRDVLASFSSYGGRTVHVSAPGVDVLSTVPRNGYAFKSGTSMAAPHVTGAVAMLQSKHPNLTPAQIVQQMVRTSDRVETLERRVQADGRINLYKLMGGR